MEVLGLSTQGNDIMYKNSEGRSRACIIIKKQYKALLIPSLSNEDLAVVKIDLAR